MNIKKIFPLEINFEIRNMKEYFKHRTVIDFSKRKKIFFCDAATYNNLGDQAISISISKILKDYFSEYEYIEINEKDFLRNFKYLSKNIGHKDIICLNGGGNMGNLYPRYEAIRRKVIKKFKNNKIIIFPQTIDYEEDNYGKGELNRSIKLYNGNKNLLVCAREIKSYNKMSKIYSNVILVPDIVFYLFNTEIIPKKKLSNDKTTIGICLRNDKESLFTNDKKKMIIEDIKKMNYNVKILSTMSNEKFIDSNNREQILIKKLEEFSECDYIISDRLHGMIFSILCSIPCIAFDNSNKKVSGVYGIVKKSFNNVLILNEWNKKKFLEFLSNNIKKDDFDKEEAYKEILNY